MIKAIIFDCDGTLVDSETLSAIATDHAFRSILKRPLTEEESNGLLGRPANRVLKEWFPDRGKDIFEEASAYFRERMQEIKPYDDIEKLLNILHNDFRFAVVSSSSRFIVQEMLDITGLNRYFELVIGHEDTEKHKPDPEPLMECIKRLGLAESECIYVGDQPYDIMAARSAGIVVLGTTWGSGNSRVLREYKPHAILEKPLDILSLKFDRLI